LYFVFEFVAVRGNYLEKGSLYLFEREKSKIAIVNKFETIVKIDTWHV
jgi:hypothetical protein